MITTYIHTLGRPDRQYTYGFLKAAGMEPTLVVQHHEYDAHVSRLPAAKILRLPPHIKTLSPTRQWLLENCPSRYMTLMDDDLRFGRKDPDDRTKILAATNDDLRDMVIMINRLLLRYTHVGVSSREGNNRKPNSYYKNERMMRVLSYDRHRVPSDCRFDRLPCKQDFDMTLQLLRAGLQNAVIYEYTNDQVAGSNATGGCSAYRTLDMTEQAAHDLKKLHPKFVTLTQKANTNWKGMGAEFRTEVMIQWKKALAAG